MTRGEPTCGGVVENDACFVENFERMRVSRLGRSFQTRAGFDFELFRAPDDGPELAIRTFQNLGQTLWYPCYSTRVAFPEAVDYARFSFKGFPAKINFQAYDSSGAIVDEEVRHNADADGIETVVLGPGTGAIAEMEMHHVAADDDQLDCWNSVIAQIQACEKRAR